MSPIDLVDTGPAQDDYVVSPVWPEMPISQRESGRMTLLSKPGNPPRMVAKILDLKPALSPSAGVFRRDGYLALFEQITPERSFCRTLLAGC